MFVSPLKPLFEIRVPNVRNPLVPFHVVRSLHPTLAVIRLGQSPAEYVRRRTDATRIESGCCRRKPPQKRLFEIPSLRQWPTTGRIERVSREAIFVRILTEYRWMSLRNRGN